MEATRKIIGILFWIVVVIGGIGLTIALVGGAFPINWGTGEQTVKFDLTYNGWESSDPMNGIMTIVHDEKKEGWGAMQFDYKYGDGKEPGFRSTVYDIEGAIITKFWMKAKKPCKWQLQYKRKSDGLVLKRTFNVGTNWKQYTVNTYDMKNEIRYTGKFSANELAKWINFVDISSRKEGESNTVWIDHVVITK
ncbi:MAG: hypothetical protein LWY06_00035 [Firmicutes bacterium]|nr:hypothetical protein [Bacillota bacterium]